MSHNIPNPSLQPAWHESATVQVRINATAAEWHALTEAKARASAATRHVEQLEKAMGIPDAKEVARLCGISAEVDAKVSALIVDGNDQPLGKLTVFWFPGCAMPAGFRRRIT